MKIQVVSANIGGIDPAHLQNESVFQVVPKNWNCATMIYTEEQLPPRPNSLSLRLQSRIPKTMAWELLPGANYYIWMDSAFTFRRHDAVKWLVSKCYGVDMAIFAHPDRRTIKQEAEYIKTMINRGNKYLIDRYEGEPLLEQIQMYQRNGFDDSILYMCGVFIYKNTARMRQVMKEWFRHCCVYELHDQISLPYVLWENNAVVRVLPGNGLRSEYFRYHWSH